MSQIEIRVQKHDWLQMNFPFHLAFHLWYSRSMRIVCIFFLISLLRLSCQMRNYYSWILLRMNNSIKNKLCLMSNGSCQGQNMVKSTENYWFETNLLCIFWYCMVFIMIVQCAYICLYNLVNFINNNEFFPCLFRAEQKVWYFKVIPSEESYIAITEVCI